MKQKKLLSLEAQDKMNVNNHCHPSGTVEALFAGAIDRIRTEAEEIIVKQKVKTEAEAAKAIAEVKAEAEEKARVYTETIARVKAQAEESIAKVKAEAREKARAYADAIARIKAKVQKKAKADTDRVAEGKPSVTVGALFSEALAKQKAKSEAEAAEAIAEIKAEAQDKTRAYTETITEVKVEAENTITQQKAKSEAEAAEAAARVKVEAEEAIARLRAEATDAITRVKAEVTDAITKAMAEAKEKAGVYTNKEIAKVKPKEEAAVMDRMEELPVSETIQRMAQSAAVLPHENSIPALETPFCDLLQNEPLELCAKDIMQKEVVWASPDDSIQQAFAKMQQHDADYIIVGHEGLLEGIISKSDLKGAISPYMRPMFAKWRRPMDDATLQIRIKWIMSKPVHTISSQMSLATIMINMCRSRVSCLPVVDAQDEVQGLVAETNILKAVLNLMQAKCSTSAKVRQEQPASAHPTTARAELES
ncbi:MAG: CBS domain-containing protein [Planctomycetota bacterium]|jgi:CBS domain-containing protein